MKICLAGATGSIGSKHLTALATLPEVELRSIAGDPLPALAALAAEYAVPHFAADWLDAVSQPGVEAVVLATPTPCHAEQVEICLDLGKHVLVEIPLADRLAPAQDLVGLAAARGLVLMAAHTRRFNPGHQWLQRKILAGELRLQHLIVETLFMRRRNVNAQGVARDWADDLLWHHACHSVDLFLHQGGGPVADCQVLAGPRHAELGIPLDMQIGLRGEGGALASIALSFNHAGPFGSTFRYICDRGTYLAVNDGLTDGDGNVIDLGEFAGAGGILLQDREFVGAIRAGREPMASGGQCLPALAVLDRLARQLSSAHRKI